MDETSRLQPELTIGVDLGDRHSHLCTLDRDGEVLEEARIATTPTAMRRRFEAVPRCRLVLEVGTHSPWTSRLLDSCGHEVVVANPRRVRLIADADDKQDRTDAEQLARLGRVDPKLLRPIRHRGVDCQRDRAGLRSRTALVRARTQLVNHLRGIVKAFGARLRGCSTESFHKQAPAQIPPELRTALQPVVDVLATLSRTIRAYDRQLEQMATKQYPETTVLRQVPGVGPLTSLSYVLTLEDPDRFPRSRTVGAYLGLTQRRRQSGAQDPELRISKRGDPELRRLLVSAAQYTLGPFGPDTDLRRWGLALAARDQKNAKRRAVVAVARKLAVLLHRLWMTGETYEPLRCGA